MSSKFFASHNVNDPDASARRPQPPTARAGRAKTADIRAKMAAVIVRERTNRGSAASFRDGNAKRRCAQSLVVTDDLVVDSGSRVVDIL